LSGLKISEKLLDMELLLESGFKILLLVDGLLFLLGCLSWILLSDHISSCSGVVSRSGVCFLLILMLFIVFHPKHVGFFRIRSMPVRKFPII